MGLEDTFHFDRAAYRRKLLIRSTEDLKTHEITKQRQHVSAGVVITGSIGLALSPIGGFTSLPGAAIGSRKLYVAQEKLAMIEAELRNRDEELHETTARDVLVPLTVGVASLAVGTGLEEVIGVSTGAAEKEIMDAIKENPIPAIEAPVLDPGKAMQHAIEGVIVQVQQLSAFATGGIQEAQNILPTSIDTSTIPSGPNLSDDPDALVGNKAGMMLAHKVEVLASRWGVEKLTTLLFDRK